MENNKTEFIAKYKGKKWTVMADSVYQAQLKALEHFKVPKSRRYELTVNSKESMERGDFRFLENGGNTTIDLFEDYGSQPKELAKITTKWLDILESDGLEYKELEQFKREVEAIGYTFDYGLDAEPYGLRKIMAKGGQTKSSKSDTVTVNIPLLIRLMEYSREDAESDVDLHKVAENLTELSKSKGTLTMNDYMMAVAKHNYKKGGETKRKISIVNDGVKFDKKKYQAIYDDFDGDGTVNIDDASPLDKTKKGQVEQVPLKDTFDKLLDVKSELDTTMHKAINKLDKKAPKDADIYARTKTPYSILKKLVEKRMLDPDRGLTDMIGTTIAVENQKELEQVRDDIDGGLLGKILDRDDYYTKPKQGYRAYHYIVEFEGVPVEVQLKTKKQKKLHEISHEFYKKGTLDSKGLDEVSILFMKADKGDSDAIKEVNALLKDKSKLASKVTKTKLAKGGETPNSKPRKRGNPSLMITAKKRRKAGEKWNDCIKRVANELRQENQAIS